VSQHGPCNPPPPPPQPQDLDEARTFVEGLKLCCPPSHPDITGANGGDGDENHKAALYQMVELDPSVPTISFLITDAGPHFRSASGGQEARQELSWLADKDLPPQVGDTTSSFQVETATGLLSKPTFTLLLPGKLNVKVYSVTWP
jgi:hypothetical protein